MFRLGERSVANHHRRHLLWGKTVGTKSQACLPQYFSAINSMVGESCGPVLLGGEEETQVYQDLLISQQQ